MFDFWQLAWRALATGFAGALSNVADTDFSDGMMQAGCVLCLGSLLLSQLRHEHGELIEGVQTAIDPVR